MTTTWRMDQQKKKERGRGNGGRVENREDHLISRNGGRAKNREDHLSRNGGRAENREDHLISRNGGRAETREDHLISRNGNLPPEDHLPPVAHLVLRVLSRREVQTGTKNRVPFLPVSITLTNLTNGSTRRRKDCLSTNIQKDRLRLLW